MSHKGPVERIDWLEVMLQLQRRGYSVQAVAQQLRLQRTTLLNWKNHGTEPRHVDGENLLEFWARVMEQDKSKAPRTHAPPWLG